MQLTVWTYEGPPHVGAMRVATAMRGVHYVLHAPQGDTYADLLFTMIERRDRRPPVTYTTFQARDLGGDTAQLLQSAVADAFSRFTPDVMLVGASCTAELIQDDPGGLAQALRLPIPVVPLELPAYQRKENWGASETFFRLVRALALPAPAASRPSRERRARAVCNLLGPTALGFRHRDDLAEVTRQIADLGIDIGVTAPWNATAADLARLGDADFNVVLYPEIALTAAKWLEKTFGQPFTRTIPIGVDATRRFIEEVARLAGVDPASALSQSESRLPWYSRSVNSTYLTGKRVFIFGDATHAIAAARVASGELGFDVVGLGTYSREFARELREAAAQYGVEPLITDDYLEVETKVAELQPELRDGNSPNECSTLIYEIGSLEFLSMRQLSSGERHECEASLHHSPIGWRSLWSYRRCIAGDRRARCPGSPHVGRAKCGIYRGERRRHPARTHNRQWTLPGRGKTTKSTHQRRKRSGGCNAPARVRC